MKAEEKLSIRDRLAARLRLWRGVENGARPKLWTIGSGDPGGSGGSKPWIAAVACQSDTIVPGGSIDAQGTGGQSGPIVSDNSSSSRDAGGQISPSNSSVTIASDDQSSPGVPSDPGCCPVPAGPGSKPRIAASLCLGLSLLLLLALWPAPPPSVGTLAGAVSIPQGAATVRVALGLGQSSATLSAQQGAYTLGDPDQGTESGSLGAGQALTVRPAGQGLALTRDGSSLSFGGSRLLLAAGGTATDLIAYGSRSYRGSFVVENRGGLLNIINVLDVDQYLPGVLPLEMGMSTAPAEALKAQAVVSRSYALKQKNSSSSYDLVSGSADQLYGGYGNERSYTTAAVEATRGQAIYYDGQLITAFFSSNAGGFTEDAENVWNEALPYLKATPSTYDAHALESAQDASGYPANTYSWQVRYTLAELESRISEWNQDHPDGAIRVGKLLSMSAYPLAYQPETRRITAGANASGRITRLDLVGDSGSHTLYKEEVRSFLGLRSTLFTLAPEGGVAVMGGAGATVMLGQGIRESKAVAAYGQPVEINPGSDSFFVATAEGVKEFKKDDAGVVTAYVINGRGYGHGVGLSQWGAIGMGEAGFTYGQIIEHYFNQDKNDGRLTVRSLE